MILVILCHAVSLLAQNVIRGKLYHKGIGIEGVSVLIHELGDKNAIIAFAITHSDGNYEVEVKTELDTISITSSSLNYVNITKNVANKDQVVDFELSPQEHNIKEVTVKADPILFKKDTLIFNVGAFAGESDRSIGDVIAKLPGFEVSSNGLISYQGQKIEKYYIEGLDLLEGRYSVANKNLSYEAVRSIEVLENHQPVKMLDSLVYSDKTSINIRLKKDLSLATKAQMGIGTAPLLWSVNLTPMIFNKKQQAIISYQTNNIGDDVSEQLIAHYFNEMKDETGTDILSLVSLTSPMIDKSRYLDNNIHMLTYNHILKFSDDANIKFNTSYVSDTQKQEGSISSVYLLEDDTIRTHELLSNEYVRNRFSGNLIYNKNAKNEFIKNKLSFSKYWDQSFGDVYTDEEMVTQELRSPFYSINNHLKWIFPVANSYITVKSKISYTDNIQKLEVTPGVFDALLNDSVESRGFRQDVNLNNFTTDNSLSFTLGRKHWRLDSRIGFEFEKKQLNSRMDVNGIEKEEPSLHNNLNWKYLSPFIAETFRYETPDLNLGFEMPVRKVSYNINDKKLLKKESVDKLLFNPAFYLFYRINGYLTLNTMFDYSNHFGRIDEIYYGSLVSNYRTLSVRNIPLSKSNNYNCTTQFKYTDPIRNWIATLIISQSFTSKNILLDRNIAQNGTTEINALVKDNNNRNTNVLFTGSKLFYALGTTLYLKANYSFGESENMINAILQNVKNVYWGIEPRISFTKLHGVNVDYKFQYAFMRQDVGENEISFNNSWHIFNLNFYPFPRHSVGINLEYYSTETTSPNNNQTYYTNINYRWKSKKMNMEMELKCYNLLNDDRFISYYNTELASIRNSYHIRPRQFVVSFDFSF